MAKRQQTAAQLVEALLKGMRAEEVAMRLRVSVNTVFRWRRGVVPQPGHMAALRELAEQPQRAA